MLRNLIFFILFGLFGSSAWGSLPNQGSRIYKFTRNDFPGRPFITRFYGSKPGQPMDYISYQPNLTWNDIPDNDFLFENLRAKVQNGESFYCDALGYGYNIREISVCMNELNEVIYVSKLNKNRLIKIIEELEAYIQSNH